MSAKTTRKKTTSVDSVLKTRAKELAKPLDSGDKSVDPVEIVEFTLGPESYAFPSSFVTEVFRLIEITPLPSLPPFVMGVTNVRGRILSVVDLRRLLDFGDTGLTNLNRAIILNDGEMELAILADEVTGVYASDSDKWQKSLPTLVGKREAYLRGVTRDRVVVLDAQKLLRSRDLLVGAE